MSQPSVPAPAPDAPASLGRRTRRGRVWATLATALVAGLGALGSGRSWLRMDRRPPFDRRPGDMMTWSTANPPAVVLALLVLAAASALAVWWSPRRPRAAYGAVLVLTAAYLALQGPVPAALVAPALTLAAVLRSRPSGEWLGWTALLVPALWAHAWPEEWLGLADPVTYTTVVTGVAWVLIPALLLQAAGHRRAAVASRREEELRRVAYEERLRVVRDIHDVVGHSLSMISLQSGVALHVFDTNPEQARASLTAIRDASRSSLAELRQTLGVFRAGDEAEPLGPTPELAGIPALVESVRAGGRDIGLAVDAGAGTGVPAGVQAVAYRVVQEGLTNAVRHAPGAPVAVAIERKPGALVVRVLDHGPATVAPAEGNGLRGMRERVEALGGELRVGVRPGGGLALEATLPTGGDA